MLMPKQTVKQRLEQAGFGPAIIRECQRFAESHSNAKRVAGGSLLGLLVSMALAYLLERWLEAFNPDRLWFWIAFFAFFALVAGSALVGSIFRKPASSAKLEQLEAQAIFYIYRMARDAERDPSGQPETMLRRFAVRLDGIPEGRQPAALVDILELDPKPMGPMGWYQVGLVIAILGALALAIWLFAPAL